MAPQCYRVSQQGERGWGRAGLEATGALAVLEGRSRDKGSVFKPPPPTNDRATLKCPCPRALGLKWARPEIEGRIKSWRNLAP